MTIATIIDSLNSFMNSGLGFGILWLLLVGTFMWLSSKFNPFQEKWKQWESSIITGIKLAEKEIPDNSPNSGLAKLDKALRFVLKAYGDANGGKQPNAKAIQQIKEGIQIKHNELDRLGDLKKAKEEA